MEEDNFQLYETSMSSTVIRSMANDMDPEQNLISPWLIKT